MHKQSPGVGGTRTRLVEEWGKPGVDIRGRGDDATVSQVDVLSQHLEIGCGPAMALSHFWGG